MDIGFTVGTFSLVTGQELIDANGQAIEAENQAMEPGGGRGKVVLGPTSWVDDDFEGDIGKFASSRYARAVIGIKDHGTHIKSKKAYRDAQVMVWHHTWDESDNSDLNPELIRDYLKDYRDQLRYALLDIITVNRDRDGI